jgi:hypothetical protein
MTPAKYAGMIKEISEPLEFPQRALLDGRNMTPEQAQAKFPGATVYVYRRKRSKGIIVMIDPNPPGGKRRDLLSKSCRYRLRRLRPHPGKNRRDHRRTPRPTPSRTQVLVTDPGMSRHMPGQLNLF